MNYLGKEITTFFLFSSLHFFELKTKIFYEDLQDLLELTPKKDALFIIGDWNAKVGGQETPGITGKFGLGNGMKQGKG